MFVLNTGKDRRPLKGHSIAKIWQGGHGLAEKRLKRITIWIKKCRNLSEMPPFDKI